MVGLGFVALTNAPVVLAQSEGASKSEIRRGEYLVGFGGCHDCHTPKAMTPNGPVPDKARLLSGHPANAQTAPLPHDLIGPGPNKWAAITNSDLTAWAGPWGTSFAANLTPDAQTGIGTWTSEQFIKTIRTGRHFGDGRPLLPPMPWFDVAVLSDRDLKAVFAYLQSVKPIQNRVPLPQPPK